MKKDLIKRILIIADVVLVVLFFLLFSVGQLDISKVVMLIFFNVIILYSIKKVDNK